MAEFSAQTSSPAASPSFPFLSFSQAHCIKLTTTNYQLNSVNQPPLFPIPHSPFPIHLSFHFPALSISASVVPLLLHASLRLAERSFDASERFRAAPLTRQHFSHSSNRATGLLGSGPRAGEERDRDDVSCRLLLAGSTTGSSVPGRWHCCQRGCQSMVAYHWSYRLCSQTNTFFRLLPSMAMSRAFYPSGPQLRITRCSHKIREDWRSASPRPCS